MLSNDILRSKFQSGYAYDDYVASGTPDQQTKWRDFHARVAITPAQRTLLGGFTRQVNILIVSGTWCGDCVQQVPMFDHIERANPGKITLRIVDRDKNLDLAEPLAICSGLRVPTVIFLNEDFDFCSLMGDRSLARYRAIAAAKLGASCPLPGAPVPADEIASTLQDWVNELERVQLMLRLSPKLRERHAD
ncbi:MAG: thioredoxin family protein [Phycisphaeraceae bacterium]|nr:thioredoxin family protein [Phycisphaeraceae bacterium]MCW5769393.1 thioredoxin family protein [Phycisphaeraceae bacterium]